MTYGGDGVVVEETPDASAVNRSLASGIGVDGAHTIKYRATDPFGRKATLTASVEVNVSRPMLDAYEHEDGARITVYSDTTIAELENTIAPPTAGTGITVGTSATLNDVKQALRRNQSGEHTITFTARRGKLHERAHRRGRRGPPCRYQRLADAQNYVPSGSSLGTTDVMADLLLYLRHTNGPTTRFTLDDMGITPLTATDYRNDAITVVVTGLKAIENRLSRANNVTDTYTLTFTATDTANQSVTAYRTVRIVLPPAPTVTLEQASVSFDVLSTPLADITTALQALSDATGWSTTTDGESGCAHRTG